MIVETQIHSLAILFSLCESLHPSIIRQWCVGFPPMVLFPIGVLRFRFRHETFPFLLRHIYGLAFSKSKKRFRPQIWDPGKTDSDCTELQYRLWPDLIHSIHDEEEFSRWPLVFPEWVLAYLCSQKLTGDEEIQRLRCIVKNYEWGKFGPDSLVGRLHEVNLGRQVDRLISQTELWMGTHESGLSHVESGLGPNLLFTVLSVQALPLQAQVFVDVILDLQRRVRLKPTCHYKSPNRLIVGCCRFALVSFVQTVTLRWVILDRSGLVIWVDIVIFFVIMLKRIIQVQYFKETLVRKCWCHYVYIPELALDTWALMLRFVKRSHSQRLLLYTIRNKEESNMKLDNNRSFDRLASKATLRKASSNSLLLYFLLVYGTYICVCNNCISLILYVFVRTLLD